MASKTKAAEKQSKNGTKELLAVETFQPITLNRLEKRVARVPIVGVTPVIPHRWTEKAKRMMLDKQQGKASEKKAPKNPEAEARESTYWCADGRPGIQAVGFKAAVADAARFFDKSVTIEMLKRAIHIFGEVTEHGDVVVPIDGEITMREDTPRNSGSTADLRYRNQVWPWSAELHVEYISSLLTEETLVTLIDAAGINGVGDWRPSAPKSKSGTFGKFQVAEGS